MIKFDVLLSEHFNMRNQLQLSEVTEALERGKNYLEVQVDLYDLEDLCKNTDNPQILEYVPVKIVACFEQFFRDEYKEILINAKTKKKLKGVEFFKNAKFDFDIIGAFEDNTISLGDYLAYLIPCSKLNDIHNALSQLLGIDFLVELSKKKEGRKIIESINEIFRLRHIYCHEVPYKEMLDLEKVNKLIHHACEFLDDSDDIIRNALYSDNSNYIEEIEIAKRNYNQSNLELGELLDIIKMKQDRESLFYNDFSYIEKWKEYREERALCDSSVNYKKTHSPLHYYRNLDRTTKALIRELKEDYKYELKR